MPKGWLAVGQGGTRTRSTRRGKRGAASQRTARGRSRYGNFGEGQWHEADGVVFDGTAADFHLPSGGMRDRSGTTVVEATDVAIGKLEVHP
jgi:hypothetical protein